MITEEMIAGKYINLFRKSVIKTFTLILLCAVAVGCDDFFDVNENPNSPTEGSLPLSAKLPAAIVSTVNQETLQLNQIGAFWGGYWGTTNEGIGLFVDLKTYNGPAIRHQRDGIRVWEDAYTTMLYYRLILNEAETEGQAFYAGIARIMLGWHFLRLVDFYDAVPFDDALQGNQIPTPRYEDGRTVYRKALEMITRGIDDIKNAAPGTAPGSDDVLFNGDARQWIRFANTIKLRALIRQSEVTDQEQFVTSALAEIAAEGSGFLEAGESALVDPGYVNTAGKLNPFWENYYRTVQSVATSNYQDIRPTEFALEQYKLRNDPRLQTLYVDVNGSYNGVLFGNPDTAPEYSRSATSAFRGPHENGGQPAALFKAYNQPSVLMSDAESLFLQAEAAHRGWITGSAKDYYEQAIRASFRYMEIEDNAFATYNAQSEVSFDAAGDKLERIIEQKWLALNSISSIEAWNDYRRVGLPAIPNSLEAPTATARPLRLMYPETERMTNNEEASRVGSDDMLKDRVWWDVKQ